MGVPHKSFPKACLPKHWPQTPLLQSGKHGKAAEPWILKMDFQSSTLPEAQCDTKNTMSFVRSARQEEKFIYFSASRIREGRAHQVQANQQIASAIPSPIHRYCQSLTTTQFPNKYKLITDSLHSRHVYRRYLYVSSSTRPGNIASPPSIYMQTDIPSARLRKAWVKKQATRQRKAITSSFTVTTEHELGRTNTLIASNILTKPQLPSLFFNSGVTSYNWV